MSGVLLLGTLGLVGCANTEDNTAEDSVEETVDVADVTENEETEEPADNGVNDPADTANYSGDVKAQYTTSINQELIYEHEMIYQDILVDFENGDYTLEEPLVVQDPYDRAPLTALVLFESAGRRIYNMGVSSHKAKNYQLANTYYSLLLNEPMINDSIQTEVQTYYNQASKGQRLTTALDYFNLVMNAPNATSAWTRVNDYSNAFPYDQRLETAIDNAARRVLSMAVTHHKNGRYSNARTYYRPLANSSLISQSMSDKVDELIALANKNRKLLSESQYSNEVKNASSSSEAWNIAIEGINLYPNHSRTQKGLNEAANRNLKLGRSYQRNGNNTQAGIYFNRVYNEKRVSESIRTLARVFLNQLQETHRPVVYVDPGHGGYDPGATHPSYRNIGEKVLNLNTSMYLKEELESRGYIVIMSRENDTFIGLTERAIEANDAFSDIFVSAHYNSMGGSGAARGIETFIHHTLQNKEKFGQETNKNNFLTEDPRIDESLRLAESVHASLINHTSMYDRGVKGNNFNVLRNTVVPAVLLELGFMDNTSEFQKIRQASYQRKAAKAVADGIDAYFSSVIN